MHSFETIQEKAIQLLKSCGKLTAPVNLEAIAEYLSLRLEPSIMDEDTSGMLVIKNGNGIIGFNHRHPDVRKRFTIAHEIGHYILHHVKADESDDLYVDKTVSIYHRKDQSNREEKEANVFAASLLMPEDLVKKEASKFIAIGDSEIEKLAEHFEVSIISMTYRLMNLGVIETD
ncbi:MAG: ImmA/IrrE family metallo-endopeptidase [Cyclobacteriaceae bacterium]